MRVAIAGLGLRSAHVIKLLREVLPELQVVGYVDPSPCGLERLGVTTPLKSFPGVSAMLSDTTPDLLFVGSPNHLHLEHIRAGLEAKVRIFTEKPVVTSAAQTFELAELLAQYGADRVLVGLVLRYSRHMRDLREGMRQGWLGPVASMEANEHIAPYHGSFFMRDWRRKVAYSGGFMLEKCCHDLDLYNMIAGCRPVRVASFGGRRSFVPEHAPPEGAHDDVYQVKRSYWEAAEDPFRSDADIIDFQTATMEFESGAGMVFHTNLNTPDQHRRFCVIGAQGMAEGDFMRGYLRITEARTGKRLLDQDYASTSKDPSGHYGADEMMVADLAAYFREETDTLPVSIVDALEAGLVALELDEARLSGTVRDLTPLWKRLDAFGLR
ncbi:MAG: Gfo/Idh/MocA family protein [bacterium]|jgi:predicted dehydrogenase